MSIYFLSITTTTRIFHIFLDYKFISQQKEEKVENHLHELSQQLKNAWKICIAKSKPLSCNMLREMKFLSQHVPFVNFKFVSSLSVLLIRSSGACSKFRQISQ